MTSERTVVLINDLNYEQYKKNAKEMEHLILAAERSYKRIERIRNNSIARHGKAKSIGWIKIGNTGKLRTK